MHIRSHSTARGGFVVPAAIVVALVLSVGAVLVSSYLRANPATTTASDYSDLVLNLTFDSDSGSTVLDSSKYKHNGTANGTVVGPGKFGNGRSFNGTSDSIVIPHADALSPTSAITMEAWVYLDKSDSMKILQKRGVFSDTAGGYMLGAWFGNPRGYGFEVYDAQQHLVNTTPERLPTTQTWTHVAATYDGSTLKIYENGQLVGTTAWSGTITRSTKDLWIGMQSDNSLMPFKGTMDEIRIYNRALAAEEVACSYQGNVWHNGACAASANRAPIVVSTTGPSTLDVNVQGTWTVKVYDPDGGRLSHSVDWGDGGARATDGAQADGAGHLTTTFAHAYGSAGTYTPQVTVTDAAGLSTTTAAPSVTVSVPQTLVSGSITESTTWQRSKSPYIVTDDVTLFPGATLTVEPGVTVRFKNGKRLVVRGALVAEGTSSDRITFTTYVEPAVKGLWIGIQIQNQQGGKASLKYATVEYTTSGLSVECCGSGGPITIADATFRENDTALGGYSGDVRVRVDRTTFANNTNAVTQADKDIYDSTFRNNTCGLCQTERVSVYRSAFTGNRVAAWGGRGTFTQNSVTNNETGVQAFFEGWKTTYNTITANGVGIILAQYSPEVSNNNILENTTYNAKVTGPSNITATNNWWGATDTTAIDAKVYDGKDNASLGLLTVSPMLSGRVDIVAMTAPPAVVPPPAMTPAPTPTGSTLSGSIFESLTLRRSQSPYTVSGDVTLFPGATLTVEPGVVVRFADGKKLAIRGAFIAEGTSSDRITFTTDRASPAKNAWSGIQVQNQQGGKASLKFATVEYASTGLSVECCHSGGPITIADVTFRENTMALGGYAGDVRVRVDRTTFENNTYAVTQADKDIYDSTFRNNRYGLHQTERVSVYRSTFTGHTIAAWGGRGNFTQNSVTNNEHGVVAFFEGWKTTYNTITANGVGIILAQYSPEVSNNSILANTTYDAQVTGPSNITAANNWWGTTDTSAIDAKVYDGRDSASLGILAYQPVLTQVAGIPNAPTPTPPPATTPIPTGTTALPVSPAGNTAPRIAALSGPHALAVGMDGTWLVTMDNAERDALTFDIVWGDGTKFTENVPGLPEVLQRVNVSKRYATAGTYTISFAVRDAAGLWSERVGWVVTVSATATTPTTTATAATTTTATTTATTPPTTATSGTTTATTGTGTTTTTTSSTAPVTTATTATTTATTSSTSSGGASAATSSATSATTTTTAATATAGTTVITTTPAATATTATTVTVPSTTLVGTTTILPAATAVAAEPPRRAQTAEERATHLKTILQEAAEVFVRTLAELSDLVGVTEGSALAVQHQQLVEKVVSDAVDTVTKERITNFVAVGTQTTLKLGAGERAGVVDSFRDAFGREPQSEDDWADTVKIANGRFPGQRNLAREQEVRGTFLRIYLREPDFNSPNDAAAMMTMAYGMRPEPRNVVAEQSGIRIFKRIFGRAPTTASDWDAVRAIAYSGAKR